MPVRIVTDSSSGLPDAVVEELGITVVDLHVMGGGDEEASTAGLSSLELTAAYARQLERGGDDGVLALHLSKELSSTWSSAVQAAAVFPDTVRVVDTGSVGMAVGAAAMAAATLALEGADLTACHDMAVDILERSATWVYLHRIEEIRKSGRMSAATTLLSAALLATKPIMEIRDGKLELAGKTRTQTKAFARLVELVGERADDEPVFLAIQHNDAREAAGELQELLEDALPDDSSFMCLEMENTLAVHVGPGAVGVSAVFATAPVE
ncbi:DegV family protein [Corynebacterium halotolerans]|uniref:DegV family protein n=1 Tax=Corynebacterium halotolerans YIM 70093 = DSM 44683 TaxID=1121362 RepID=M1NP79_9CORY|nr:DegV family protein [Corynebacterium halotolerans]AGF73178.1 DegV family protein [Corynebacterium halotolerans YIM 70093 = DSM 44683]